MMWLEEISGHPALSGGFRSFFGPGSCGSYASPGIIPLCSRLAGRRGKEVKLGELAKKELSEREGGRDGSGWGSKGTNGSIESGREGEKEGVVGPIRRSFSPPPDLYLFRPRLAHHTRIPLFTKERETLTPILT